jgi:hypothetical protein
MNLISFGRTATYDEMLTRIAIGTIVSSFVAIEWLRWHIGTLDGILATVDKWPAIGPLKDYDKLPFGTILPAIVIGVLCRIIKLHDRLSDVFAIRKRFDISEILIPICGHCDKKMTSDRLDALSRDRHKWVRLLFYEYASSFKDKAIIDENLIRQALDWWTWAWVALESSAIFLVACIIAYWSTQYKTAFQMLTVANCLFITSSLLRTYGCRSTARAEVNAIMDNEKAASEIRKKLNAL